jgi:hypothetical protein
MLVQICVESVSLFSTQVLAEILRRDYLTALSVTLHAPRQYVDRSDKE